MNAEIHTPKRYRVFLSYRHDDNRDPDRLWANWLKNELERYQVPPDLVRKPNQRGELIPPTLAPVFRDEDSLGAVADLGKWIIHGLMRSEALICICSPRSARSQWVRDELKRFKEMGKGDHIQALVIDGQPRASEGDGSSVGATPAEECFAVELLRGSPHPQFTTPEGYPVIDWSARADPLYADLRPEGTRTQGFTSSGAYRQALEDRGDVPLSDIEQRVAAYEERLRHVVRQLVAGILGVDLDDLHKRESEEKAKRLKRRNRLVAGVAVVMFILVCLMGWFWWRAGVATTTAVAAELEQKRQRDLANRESAQRLKLLQEIGRSDHATAEEAFRGKEWRKGVAYLGRALRNDPNNESAVMHLASALLFVNGDRDDGAVAEMIHGLEVKSAEFSSDGRLIVTASSDGTARLWSASSGQPIGLPMRHEGAVNFATFSPDSRLLVTASDDHTARFWDAATGEPFGEPMPHANGVTAALFSPDGSCAITFVRDDKAIIWDVSSCRFRAALTHLNTNVEDATFSADGRIVATLGNDGSIRMWEVSTGKVIQTAIETDSATRKIVFSPSGHLIGIKNRTAFKPVEVFDFTAMKTLSGPIANASSWTPVTISPDCRYALIAQSHDNSEHDSLRLWTIENWQPVGEAIELENNLDGALFNAHGDRFAIKVDNGAMQVFSTSPLSEIGDAFHYPGHLAKPENAHAFSFSPNGESLITATTQGIAYLWELAPRVSEGAMFPHEINLYGGCFSPDGSRVVTITANSTVYLWDVAKSTLLVGPIRLAASVRSAAFSPDGREFFTVCSDRSVHRWDGFTAVSVGKPFYGAGDIYSAAFTSFGLLASVAGKPGVVELWDVIEGKRFGQSMEHGGRVIYSDFSPDGRVVVTLNGDHTTRLWEIRTGNAIGQMIPPGVRKGATTKADDEELKFLRNPIFSPDSHMLATFGLGGAINFWSLDTGQAFGTSIHGSVGSEKHGASFSPDGRFFATTGGFQACVWNTSTGKPVGQLLQCPEKACRIFFSNDGRFIATTSCDGSARLWDASTGEPVGEPFGGDGTGPPDAIFSPNGQLLLTVGDEYDAHLWPVLLPRHAEPWIQDVIVAAGGRRFSSTGLLEEIPLSERSEALQRLKELRPGEKDSKIEDSDWARLLKWWLTRPSKRPALP